LVRYQVTAELGDTFVVVFLHLLTECEVESYYHGVLFFALALSAVH